MRCMRKYSKVPQTFTLNFGIIPSIALAMCFGPWGGSSFGSSSGFEQFAPPPPGEGERWATGQESDTPDDWEEAMRSPSHPLHGETSQQTGYGSGNPYRVISPDDRAEDLVYPVTGYRGFRRGFGRGRHGRHFDRARFNARAFQD